MASTSNVNHGRATTAYGGIGLPGTILGIGLGGFVDGILLHQVLQWHHMLSSSDTANVDIGYYPVTTVHGLQMNTLWDGLFHTFTWLAVLVGLGMCTHGSSAPAAGSGRPGCYGAGSCLAGASSTWSRALLTTRSWASIT